MGKYTGESHEINKNYFVNRKLEESDYSEVFLVRASVDGNEPFCSFVGVDKGCDVFLLPMLPSDEMLQYEILIGGIKQCKVLSEIERYKDHVIDMNSDE